MTIMKSLLHHLTNWVAGSKLLNQTNVSQNLSCSPNHSRVNAMLFPIRYLRLFLGMEVSFDESCLSYKYNSDKNNFRKKLVSIQLRVCFGVGISIDTCFFSRSSQNFKYVIKTEKDAAVFSRPTKNVNFLISAHVFPTCITFLRDFCHKISTFPGKLTFYSAQYIFSSANRVAFFLPENFRLESHMF